MKPRLWIRLSAWTTLWLSPCAVMAAAPLEIVHQDSKRLQKHAVNRHDPDGVVTHLLSRVNVKQVARDTLADKASRLNKSQRKHFDRTLRRLIEAKMKLALTNIEKFETNCEQRVDGNTGRVRCTVRLASAPDESFPVTFMWHKAGRRWQVLDMEAGGRRLVKDLREQVGRILKKKGPDYLLARMQQKLNAFNVLLNASANTTAQATQGQ